MINYIGSLKIKQFIVSSYISCENVLRIIREYKYIISSIDYNFI